MIREMENSRRAQSVSNRKNNRHNTSRIETQRSTNNDDGEINATDIKNQENKIQDNPFRPSGINELISPKQPFSKTLNLMIL